MSKLHADIIKNIADGIGFDLCGIARVRNFSAEKNNFSEWSARGYGDGLDYLHRNVDKRFDVEELMPGARSVICCAVSYKNDTSLGYSSAEVPKVASYARAMTYQETIKGMLREMAGRLEEHYGTFGWRAFSDTAPILEKRWAVEAGLGFIGRNSLLISPQHGSFVLLGELIIDLPVDVYDKPLSVNGCGECRRCIEACPAQAITPWGIDTRRCISRLTVEKNGGELSAGTLSGWIFGCDECQSICPHNAQTPLYTNPLFTPLFDPLQISQSQWLSLSEEEFAAKFKSTPLSRAGYERVLAAVKSTAAK